MKNHSISRRNVLTGAAAASALMFKPDLVRAQISGPVRLGGLVPLTGAGGVWGPLMADVYKAVAEQVNAAGGVGGQKIELFIEDDQTNPDAGVLAVRKLIDVNKVAAVMGLWSSAVAAPTLPICWENKVAMLAIAASDTLADLPHQGYFIRTNVHVALQGQKIAEWVAAQGAKSVFVLLAQNPFSDPMLKGFTGVTDAKGVKSASLIYDGRKTSFRSEVDQALQAKPDIIFLGGYPQDNIIIMKDLYRADFKGKIVGTGTGITAQFIDGAGKDVVEGIYSVQPSPSDASTAYKKLQQITKRELIDSSLCQAYDQINLAILSIAQGKAATGVAIKDNIRKVVGPQGDIVDNALDGLKLIGEGKTINYEGASGPCELQPNGNVASAVFKTLQVKSGKLGPVLTPAMQVAQLLVNGVMAGAILAVPAIAFNLIFAVLQVANFSLAAHIAIGGYAAFVANVWFGIFPAYAAIAFAFVVTGVIGVVSDFVALRPLRSYGALAVAIASMALNMVMENLIRFSFGNDMRGLDIRAQRDWIISGIHVGPQQFYNFLVAVAAMAALFALLTFTPIGKAMRAVADNPRLADIKGINPERIARIAVFIAMGLGGVAGVLIALDTAIEPTIGFRVILSVFAAAVLGGLGNIPGAVVGGLLIGVAEELSLLALPVAYRSAVGFLAIIVALLFFPRGILGGR